MSVAWTTSLAFRESIVLDIQLDRFLLVIINIDRIELA